MRKFVVPSTIATATAAAAASSPVATTSSYRAYKVVPLALSQGDTASCTVIAMLLVDYFLHSSTPAKADIEARIRDGRALYGQMLARSAFASNHNTTFHGYDNGTHYHLGTNYVSPKDAYESMRRVPWSRLHNIVEHEDIVGLNLPPLTDFDGLQPDNRRPNVVELALGDNEFGMRSSLDAGIDALGRTAEALPVGDAIAGALTTGAGVSGHTVVFAMYKLADQSVRYHAVETLGCDPRTGLVSKDSTQAAWIWSIGDVGIRQYVREAFPACRRREALLELYNMQEDGTNGLNFLYNILTFRRRSSSAAAVAMPIGLEARVTTSPGLHPAFSLMMLPAEYRTL